MKKVNPQKKRSQKSLRTTSNMLVIISSKYLSVSILVFETLVAIITVVWKANPGQ